MNKWLNPYEVKPENDDSMYWVLVNNKVKMCYLNVYPNKLCWQDLGNNDFSFNETKYIEIIKPKIE